MDTNTAVADEVTNHGHKEEIHLYAAPAHGQADSTVALRWCVCPKILAQMVECEAPNPHLLLLVTKGQREVERRLVPLGQAMEFIAFRAPGTYRIQAMILSSEQPKRLKDGIERAYPDDLKDDEGNLRIKDYRIIYDADSFGKGDVQVQVSADFFAKKPPAVIWWWANLWYKKQPVDQCDFRKRCIFAFTLQLPLTLLFLCAKGALCLLIGGLLRFGFGLRGVSFVPLWHPFKHDIDEIWYDLKGSVFFSDKEKRARPGALRLLTPGILLPVASMVSWTQRVLLGYNFWTQLLINVAATAGIAGIGLLINWLGKTRLAETSWAKRRKRRQEVLARLRERIRQQEYADDLACVQCQGVPMEASLKALPKPKRTIYLRFLGFKARVCRPFAKE